jgi:sigma-E factor negative regulatory protein RseA
LHDGHREDGGRIRQEQDMTQELSSLMDGELAAGEAQRAITTCCASDEAKVDWHLYHVIGDVMRGHAPRSLSMPKDVVEALKAQPTVLAPRRPQVTLTRVALAAAASVATVGVVGWIGSQGSREDTAPVAARSNPAIQPVANTVTLQQGIQPVEVQAYLDAHRQLPQPELYRPVNNRVPAAAAR